MNFHISKPSIRSLNAIDAFV